jgi:hypothetical protein
MARYAFIVTIDNTDNRADVVKTIKGNNSILDLVEGRDAEVIGTETVFNRYVLKPSLLPAGSAEIDAVAWVGINSGVPAVVRNEYSQNTTLWRTIEFGTVNTFTRAQMQAILLRNVWDNGIVKYWPIIPGDTLTVPAAGQAGDLLSKFVAVPNF